MTLVWLPRPTSMVEATIPVLLPRAFLPGWSDEHIESFLVPVKYVSSAIVVSINNNCSCMPWPIPHDSVTYAIWGPVNTVIQGKRS